MITDSEYVIRPSFPDSPSLLEIEAIWGMHLNFLKKGEQNEKEGMISPGSLEFNDRIRVQNLIQLLDKNMDLDKSSYQKNDFRKILMFISSFSKQVNAMNVTERALRDRIDKNFNNSYMKKLWKYLSYIHYPISNVLDKNNFDNTAYLKFLIDVIKPLFQFFGEFLEKIIFLETIRDNLILSTKYHDRENLSSDIRKERIRPYKCQLTEDADLGGKEIFRFRIMYSLLSANQKCDVHESGAANATNLTLASVVDDIMKKIREESEPDIDQNQMKETKFYISEFLNKMHENEEIIVKLKLSEITIELKKVFDQSSVKMDSNLSAAKDEIKNCFDKYLSDTSTPSPSLSATATEFYMGILYEYDCFKIVTKMLSSFKINEIDSEQHSIAFLQAVIILGEAFNNSNGLRVSFDQDWTIVPKLIKLRNSLAHDLFWSDQDLQKFVKDNWSDLIFELNKLNEKIERRLEQLKECFGETNVQKLSKYFDEITKTGFLYLYEKKPKINNSDQVPHYFIKNLGLKINEKNKQSWSKHEYPCFDAFFSYERQQKNKSKSDIINVIEELENVCRRYFGRSKPNYKLIFDAFQTGFTTGNNLIFLELFYYINYIYQRMNNHVKDKNFLHAVKNQKEFHILEHVYVLLRNGRNRMLHEIWMNDFSTLSSLICFVLSNLKHNLLEMKNNIKFKEVDLALWWHLLLIKHVHRMDNSHREIQAQQSDVPGLEHLEKSIKDLIKVLLYTNLGDYDKIRFAHPNSKFPENIYELSSNIEAAVEQVIPKYKMSIQCLVDHFKDFIEKEKSIINFNQYGLHLRTPLMYILSLYDDNMPKNESFYQFILFIAEIIIQNGADPDVYSPLTFHPMHYASLSGKHIRTYMQQKCNLQNPPEGTLGRTAYTVYGFTAANQNYVHNAFYNPVTFADTTHKSMPYYCNLSNDEYPYLYNNFGETLLICAVKHSDSFFEKNVEKLIQLNANINQKEIVDFKNGEPVYGDTPLIKAVKSHHYIEPLYTVDIKESVIKCLLKYGADRFIQDSERKNCIDIAEKLFQEAEDQRKHFDVAKLGEITSPMGM